MGETHLSLIVFTVFLITTIGVTITQEASAQTLPNDFTVEGRLYDSNGVPLNQASVNLTLELLDEASPNCVLYRETQSGLNLTSSNPTSVGVFSVRLGAGTLAFPTSGAPDFTAVFASGTPLAGIDELSGHACALTPAASDHRLVRIKVFDSTSNTWDTLSPDTEITAVPTAKVAESANSLQGLGVASFLLTNNNTSLTQGNLEYVFSNSNFAILNGLLTGSSNQFMASSPTSSVSFNSQRITNVATPSMAQDAATKAYTDSTLGGSSLNLTGVGIGSGGGSTLVWNQVTGSWVAQQPSASLSSITGGTGLLGGTITSSGTLSVDVGTTANKIVQLNGLAQLPALDGSLLTNVSATRLGARSLSNSAPFAGQVLTWNNSSSAWDAESVASITSLTGDVTATGPGAATSTIGNGKITSNKLGSGFGPGELLMTDSTTGATVTFMGCSLNQILQWTASGWVCADPASTLGASGVTAGTYGSNTQVSQVQVDSTGRVTSLSNINIAFPVTSVAGKSGAVTLNALDIGGLGTAATQNTGTLAGDVVELNGSAQLPALDGSLLSDVNTAFLSGHGVSSTGPTAGQVLTYNNSTGLWDPETFGVALPGLATASIWVGNSSGVAAGVSPSGDVNMTSTGAFKVTQIQGTPVSTTPPTDAQIFSYSTAAAKWAAVSVSGDIAITDTGSSTVKKIQGVSISNTAPSAAQVLTFNSSTSTWDAEATQATLPGLASANLWVGNGSGVATAVAPSGDVSITNAGSFTVAQIQGRPVASTSPSNGQVLEWSGSQWQPAGVTSGTVTNVATGTGLLGGPFTTTGTLSVDVGTTANKIVQLNGSAQLPAVDGSLLSSVNAIRLQGTPVAGSAPSTGQILTYNGSTGNWDAEAPTYSTVRVGAGSPSAPTLSFSTDSTSGLYDAAPTGIGFSAGGSSVGILNSSGLTLSSNTLSTNPTSGTLVVEGGAGVSGNLNVGGNLVVPTLYGSTAANGTLTLDSTTHTTKGNVIILPGAGNLLLVQGGGSLGVGTPSPSTTLGFSGQVAQSVGIERELSPATAGNSLTISSGGAALGGANLAGGNLILASGISTGLGTSNILFQVSGRGSVGTSDNARTTAMAISGSGDVGIGTITPGSALDVAGALRLDGNPGNYLGFQAPATVNNPVTWTLPNGDGSNNQVLSTNGGASLSWLTVPIMGGSDTVATGSPAIPSLNFSGDTSTGFYDASPGSIGVAAAGSNILTFTSGVISGSSALTVGAGGSNQNLMLTGSGTGNVILHPNVGIGTPFNPTAPLEVESGFTNGLMVDSPSGGNSVITLTQSGTLSASIAVPYSSGGWTSDSLANDLVLRTQGGRILFNTSGGGASSALAVNTNRVGVGTTAPSYTLDVNGPVNTNSAYLFNGSSILSYNSTFSTLAVGPGTAASPSGGASANVAIGVNVMNSGSLTGSDNTVVGYFAARNLSGGGFNTAIGAGTLGSATTSGQNTAIGFNSLGSALGSANTAIGYSTGSAPTNSGNDNVMIGSGSGAGLNSGSSNVLIGWDSGLALTGGNNNVVIGPGVGEATLSTGTSNILIGSSPTVDTPAAGTTNFLNIGNTIFATGTNTGTVASPSGNVGIGTSNPQAVLDITTSTPGASAVIVPRDTTTNRPFGANGMFRFNTTTGMYEMYQSQTGTWTNPITAVSMQRYSGGGAYSPTPGTLYVIIELLGGGGGGGGVTTVTGAGSGGGSGAYLKVLCPIAQVTGFGVIGIGTPGTAASGTNGGVGGNTTITVVGGTLTAGGGTGGTAATAASTSYTGGAGGVATVGGTCSSLVAMNGYPGQNSLTTGTVGSTMAGNGANSPMGSGGQGHAGAASAGSGASGFGAGGGGAIGAGAAFAGGAGGGGVVVITEFRAY